MVVWNIQSQTLEKESMVCCTFVHSFVGNMLLCPLICNAPKEKVPFFPELVGDHRKGSALSQSLGLERERTVLYFIGFLRPTLVFLCRILKAPMMDISCCHVEQHIYLFFRPFLFDSTSLLNIEGVDQL